MTAAPSSAGHAHLAKRDLWVIHLALSLAALYASIIAGMYFAQTWLLDAWLSRVAQRTGPGLNGQHGKWEDPMSAQPSARTYNQDHVPRKYTPGKRRVSIYWTWSYPWEAQRDPAAMENRFSTMKEVRRVAWPAYETQEWSAAQFLQGIAGTLELFHRSTLSFQKIAGETTGHPVAVFQRIDQAGYKLPNDERVLADADTLMVFGLDHI